MRDQIMTAGPWTFGPDVAACFDDMLSRSIPALGELRTIVRDAVEQLAPPDAVVVDLGCSLGATLASVDNGQRRLYGVDVSPAMVARARDRLPSATITEADLTRDELTHPPADVTVVLFTLQFLDPADRVDVLTQARHRARPGSVLIMAEKLAVPAAWAATITEAYHHRKARSGYTPEQIRAKAASLAGVLRPVTAAQAEAELLDAGWSHPLPVWRSLQFAGWLAKASR